MAWEDRTPFEAIQAQFNLSEQETIALMRSELSSKSFIRWRKRVTGRTTKHLVLNSLATNFRFKCDRQRSISLHKIDIMVKNSW